MAKKQVKMKKIAPFKERCYGIYHNLIIEIDLILGTSEPSQDKVDVVRQKIRYAWGKRMIESNKDD